MVESPGFSRLIPSLIALILASAWTASPLMAQTTSPQTPSVNNQQSTGPASPTPSATAAGSASTTSPAQTGQSAQTGQPGQAAPTPQPAPVPDSFRKIRLGMTISEVESVLKNDPYFDYKGPPDVSMLAAPDENLIETTGYSFISRAFFQFYQKKLYTMILMLNPQEISYYTMYTTLSEKYGPSSSLSPDEVVWESAKYRLSLERPLSVKYIDMSVFNHLKEAGKMQQSQRSISRDQFLNQF